MRFLLDTDIFSAIAQETNPVLMQRVAALSLDQLGISIVSEGEVQFGLACRPVSRALAARIDSLLQQLQRLPLGPNVVAPYARVRAALRRAGTPIGPNDCWIAAHALAEDLTLVTGNEREFRRVSGLRVENWLR